MQGVMEIAEASKNLQSINKAVNAYDGDHGFYPSSLGQLVPSYLPSTSVLHNAGDPNPNPRHVSYTYVRPTSSTARNAPYLSTTVTYSIAGPNQTITQTVVMKMALDGTVTQQQTQTQTMGASNGTNAGKGF